MGLPLSLRKGMSDDFLVYVGELYCIVRGVDPYDVWTENVKSDMFYPYQKAELKTATRNMPIHGHTPWFYTYFSPFAFEWSTYGRWIAWELCQIPFFLVIVGVCYAFGKKLPDPGVVNEKSRGLFVAAAALTVGFTFPLRFIGNNLLMVAAALALMLHSLAGGRDVLAGMCWALVVTKPQDGFLLAIPLIFMRRWKTLLVAGVICLAASVPASLLTGKSIVDLILEVPKLKPVNQSATLIPAFLLDKLVGMGIGDGVMQSFSIFVGLSLCIVLTLLVKKSEDWLVLALPAIMCASIWTYMDSCDRCIFFVAQVLFASRFIKSKNRKERLFMVAMIGVVFCTGIHPVLYCDSLIESIGRAIGIPGLYSVCEAVIRPLNNLAMAMFVLGTVAFCVFEHRRIIRLNTADSLAQH